MSPIEHWTLPNGTPATLRPVRPHDAMALERLIDGLGTRDRRWRFHGAVNGVSLRRLRDMTNPSSSNQVALVVIAHPPDADQLIADARWAVDHSGCGAEFALMVAPAWRRLGVGQRAVAALRTEAARRDLRWLHGSVLADNAPMLALLCGTGFLCTPSRLVDGLVAVEGRTEGAAGMGPSPLSSSAWPDRLARWWPCRPLVRAS